MEDKQVVYAAYDGAEIGAVQRIDAATLETYMAEAFELNESRRQLPIPERITILERTIDRIRLRYEEIIRMAAHEGGKPYVDSKVEVDRAIQGIKVAIETIKSMGGHEIPMRVTPSSLNRLAYTMREPVGTVAAISAFNHPFNLIVHQVVPAVATGCPVIVKPAETTPLSCVNLLSCLYEAGLPEPWARLALCDHDVAEALVTDKRNGYFSFIGSSRVGWMLKSKLAPGVTCALEHGGAAPVIVEPDADIEDALPLLVKGGFYHAGQVCVSVQRVFAQESLAAGLAAQISEQAKALKVGDPLDPETEVGPLILPKETDRIEAWVAEAVDAGATLLCGGERISDTCYQPTVLLDPPDDVMLSQSEIFGPVVCVYSYRSFDEAIARANALPFFFQASIFTKHIDRALEGVRRLNARAVMVNDQTAFRVDWMPFGGRRDSGTGVGGIPYSMEEMTFEKMMVLRSPVL
ncbi:MAG: aldehyde dehydrogenase family protein [Pseudomonadota bacterium]